MRPEHGRRSPFIHLALSNRGIRDRHGKSSTSMRIATFVIVAAALTACAVTQRPAEPEPGAAYELPWGAISLEGPDQPEEALQRERLMTTLYRRVSEQSDKDAQGRPVFRILALSGGGSNGAYGAGLLTGWTKRGTRPAFDVVTGISTGALMSTYAFLGPEYDSALYIYTKISDRDIYSRRSLLSWLKNDAMADTTPLRELVDGMIDEALLDRVAGEYLAGRRLFIGTTNLDSNTFTLWDMGAIAASGRPDRLQRYRDVVLASASAPVIFSPVYIPVETAGGRYWQMHADGGMKEGIMTYGVLQEPLEILEHSGLRPGDLRLEIYGINNGRLQDRGTYNPVSPNVTEIAIASTNALLRNVMDNSLYRMWLKAQLYGIHIYLSWIPNEATGPANSFEFDNTRMRQLFQYSHELASTQDPWLYVEPSRLTPKTLDSLDPDRFLFMMDSLPE
jgi:hypothetical protein